MNTQRAVVLVCAIVGVLGILVFCSISATQQYQAVTYGDSAPEAQLGWIGELCKALSGLGGVSGVVAAVVAFLVRWQPQITDTAKKLGINSNAVDYAFTTVDIGRIAVYAKLYSQTSDLSERRLIRESAALAFSELSQKLFPADDDTPSTTKGGVR